MELPAERQLMDLLSAAPLDGRQVRLQMSKVEDVLAELLGGRAYDRRGALRGPDIIVPRGGSVPLTVEVKVTLQAAAGKNASNRVAELLAAAVETRRSFRDQVVVGAVLLFAGPGGQSDRKAVSAMARRLLRQPDGVGYDSVLVGLATSSWSWKTFSASDPAPGPDDAPADFGTLSAAVPALLSQPPAGPAVTAPAGRGARRVLLVADEWRSGLGGISTVNRELAAALAAAGAEAVVLVPQASEPDIRAATAVNVALATPALIPGLSPRELLLLRPVFSDRDWQPDIIIGHGRVLGPYAAAQQQQFFPQARRVHFVHTDAEELEAAKETLRGDSRMSLAHGRRGLERDLAQSADLVVGVGPLLAASISDELMGPGPTPPVIALVPGLRDGFVVDQERVPVRNRVLFVGRADDFQSKGIDIAADALLAVVDRWPADRPHPPLLVIRGVPDRSASAVKKRLDDLFEERVEYRLRPYVDEDEEVLEDLAQAQVVLMPSRHEGFGLSAYEAVASGVPVLISANSGLATFLRDVGLDSTPSSIVSTTNSGTRLASDFWADAIQQVLDDPLAARANAAGMRQRIQAAVTWEQSAAELFKALDAL